jgi:pimeloyl-ACP methyl ester carboxylesterase
LTPLALKEAETDLFSFANLDPSKIKTRKVYLDSQHNQMTTFEIGDPGKPKMVLVHGYGSSGALSYKLWQYLEPEFHIFAVDLIGMGSSSRPPFECRNGQEADDYMCEFFEAWRVAINITDFTLVGHSYGAYIAGMYACR